MENNELRKKFNKYTKAQIIEGIIDANNYLFGNEIENILISIENYVYQKRIDDEYKEFIRLRDILNSAKDAHKNYINELKRKYGNELKVGELTKTEFNKLIELTDEYEKAHKDFLEI